MEIYPVDMAEYIDRVSDAIRYCVVGARLYRSSPGMCDALAAAAYRQARALAHVVRREGLAQ